jgi:hypothetical protein
VWLGHGREEVELSWHRRPGKRAESLRRVLRRKIRLRRAVGIVHPLVLAEQSAPPGKRLHTPEEELPGDPPTAQIVESKLADPLDRWQDSTPARGRGTVLPEPGRLDPRTGERGQRRPAVVVDVEPPLVPLRHTRRQANRDVLLSPRAFPKAKPDAPNGIECPVTHGLEVVPEEIQVGLDPQPSLAQDHEDRDVEDRVGVEVVELKPVVVQQSAKEWPHREVQAALEEAVEGDHLAGARARLRLSEDHAAASPRLRRHVALLH